MWCPRCHGVLLSPVSAQAPAQGIRNFKWVARTPRSGARPPRRTVRRPRTTPRYDEMPRWGLLDHPVSRPDDHVSRLDRWARSASGLLVLTGALLLLAFVAELVRYGILLYNRTRLIDRTVLVTSDALVLFAEVSAIVIGIAAAVASTCWLVKRRRDFYARAGSRDPRSGRTIFLGCLVPVVSLVLPGVFLTELVDVRGRSDRHRLRMLVRLWWASWTVNWVLILGAALWRTRDSLQAQADGVLFSALLALVGAGMAFFTLRLVRDVESRSLRGADRPAPTRWVVDTSRKTEPARDEVTAS
ncbi:DUF4328 domain-containing protein [Rhodococcus sp. BP-252]|nr:DUF4328 domain-containing protein [Rhodococcus sp. BP-320]MBY6416580.1 DUF4328 domain-containing protein [Rhodococcus sp. BP-321]MBY6420614.1 DUF4328 domain-containing protein [Rhodococcus sp. BP-324]MBY6426604.1 DUF4328 domain-containing protein [Rhodococcus sp. BP-323]MBY6431603.1 DUF4328 domain-containing protein [Rhodococcus sp. BP-322]MBY6439982.1 DUF4328 domain-containing protein [Rhodococcus sp. BP-319]MBY6445494.1 DUF4328 domain-containing protein [Rhodococcus sp. BP-318]MBY644965